MQVQCKKCAERLTVDSQFAGREVRCPTCEYVFVVDVGSVQDETTLDVTEQTDDFQPKPSHLQPEAAVDLTPGSPRSATEGRSPSGGQASRLPNADDQTWRLRIPEGHEFGPVRRDILDQWVREGRVSDDCQLMPEGDDRWVSATMLYPVLDESGNPFAPTSARLSKTAPHRGGLILGLSIVGCVVPFVSLWPAVIGTRDLRLMNLGKMDPSGDGITRSGQAIAMVSSIIWIGAFAVILLVMLIRSVSSG